MLVVLAVAAVVRLREPITARIGAFHDVLVAAAVMSLLAPGGLYLFGPPFQQMYIGAQLMVWIALLLVLLFATDAALRETSRFSTGFVTGDAMAPGRSLTAFTTTHSRWAGRAEKRNRAWRDPCGIAHALFQRVNWGGRRVSNPRPPEPQSGFIPTELRPPYGLLVGQFSILFRHRRCVQNGGGEHCDYRYPGCDRSGACAAGSLSDEGNPEG